LKLDGQYIKAGIRGLAEELCTRQLGYRTEMDAAEAERREIREKRFTSLDRQIVRRAEVAEAAGSGDFVVKANASGAERTRFAQIREKHVANRLAFLESMGLASPTGPGCWRLERDFESVLKAMQRTNDRQKTLSAHGVPASDERLPISVLQWHDHPDGVQGRVLVHGQEDFSGRNYLMLEGTDAQVHYVHYTPEMEAARSEGGLRTNSFVKLRRIIGVDQESRTDVQDLGDANAMLSNRHHFRNEARELIKHGLIPSDEGWGGWMGRYQKIMRHEAVDLKRRQQAGQERDRRRRDFER
jgi:hypothetical protein